MRLSTPHKRTLHYTLSLLWLSGCLWLVFHYFLRQPGEFGIMPHPMEKWMLRLHGLMLLVVLVAIGSIIPGHSRAWLVRRQRRTGLLMMGIFTWLAATGYALYYFAGEHNEAWLPLLHWGVGLPLPLALAAHLKHRYALRRAHAATRGGSGPRAQGL
jgi:hypothetical protein